MTDEEYNRVLAAGIEFYAGLKELIKKHGLQEGDVPSVVLMAAGAVLGVGVMTPEQMTAGAQIVKKFWSVDMESDLPLKARFDNPQDN